MRSITVKDVQLYTIAMPYVERLRTSFGEEPFKTAIIVRLETDDEITRKGAEDEVVSIDIDVDSDLALPMEAPHRRPLRASTLPAGLFAAGAFCRIHRA